VVLINDSDYRVFTVKTQQLNTIIVFPAFYKGKFSQSIEKDLPCLDVREDP
jgi:hypothetical protein